MTGLEGETTTWEYAFSVDDTRARDWRTGECNSFTLPEGGYNENFSNYVAVRQTDAAGNVGELETSDSSWTIDNPAPSAPTVSVSSDGTVPEVSGIVGADGAVVSIVQPSP